jgi:ABC-2 type transport system ATP-binding protein
MIRLEGVSMHFGSTVAVDDISFELSGPGTVGLLGPNGAGKSTTMRLITTYLQPTKGKITVGGKDTAEAPLDVREQLGYLPELTPVYPEMQADEYLDFIASVRGVVDAKKRVDWVVEACGLQPVYKRPIIELSKGFKQRVGLAQALLHDPKVLILDEPTSGLDPIQTLAMRDLIAELAKEKTILLSSHILSEVSANTDRVIIINQGALIADGTLEDLQRRVRPNTRWTLEAAAPAAELAGAVQSIPGVAHVRIDREHDGRSTVIIDHAPDQEIWQALNQVLGSKSWPIAQLAPEQLSLEQIFLELTDHPSTQSAEVEQSS